MGQNQYNRSNDNDRVPEPEQNFRTRLRYRLTVLKEDFEAMAARFERLRTFVRNRKAQAAERREAQRLEKMARAAEKRAEASAEASETPREYGERDVTEYHHAAGDRIFTAENGFEEEGRVLSVTPRFWVYIALLAVAFVATQALHSKASNIFFTFMLLLPFALLLYALSARLSLFMHMISDNQTVHKGETCSYEMRLINQSVLPYPFVEAMMILPQSNAVRSVKRRVHLSMHPLGSYDVKHELSFRFRGTYYIGVNCFYVYDFFRIFRVRVDIQNAIMVSVLPRELLMEDGDTPSISDEAESREKRISMTSRVEFGDTRDYLPGDSLKFIHWNLSSRTDDLVVKDYNAGGTRTTYVYCDLSARFLEMPPSPPERTKREIRSDRRKEKEMRAMEKRKARAIASAEKHGDRVSEETLARLSETAEMRRIKKREATNAHRLEKRKKKIAAIEKKHPLKAARMRDFMLRDAEAERKTDAVEEIPAFSGMNDFPLLEDRFYEDMNEYCADGIIELSVAVALRELRRGNDVTLLWYDHRSPSGVCAYSFRSPVELQAIYPLFATAPLVPKTRFVGDLSAVTDDLSGIRQIFVTAYLDHETVTAFSELPIPSGAAEGSEILLYYPQERFASPERCRAYIEECREELLHRGIRLGIDTPEGKTVKGGRTDEAKS